MNNTQKPNNTSYIKIYSRRPPPMGRMLHNTTTAYQDQEDHPGHQTTDHTTHKL
jgi:hypothetical protein